MSELEFSFNKKEITQEKEEKSTKIKESTNTDISVKYLLQKQVDHEFANERLYLSMALWCTENGYPESAEFFSHHALEERDHGMRFINHMAKRRIRVMPPSQLEEPKREFEDMREVLTNSVEREIETSKMISNLLNNTIKEGDIAFEIASDFMKEQTEEEQLFNSLINLYDMCNGSKVDFEMEVSKIKASDAYKFGKL